MCIEDAYLNEILIPGFLQSGMPTSLYDALGAPRAAAHLGRGLHHRRHRHARRRRELLEVEPGAPVLRHSRRALAGEKVVEVSRSVYRSDRFTLWVQLGQEG